MADNTWNRRCKTIGCFGIARGDSDYCNKCLKERSKLGLKWKRGETNEC